METDIPAVIPAETINYESYLVEVNENLVLIQQNQDLILQKQDENYNMLFGILLAIAIVAGILFGKVMFKR